MDCAAISLNKQDLEGKKSSVFWPFRPSASTGVPQREARNQNRVQSILGEVYGCVECLFFLQFTIIHCHWSSAALICSINHVLNCPQLCNTPFTLAQPLLPVSGRNAH
ncbi:hypothetical protein ACJRO7_017266 [Eucalyptus globulus]|uniref:Uncharacterized protein n=1 Tax=Eucalyptus globulus TaxID=34317 RepID=A0ABD3KPM0_EUCGL